MSPLLLLLAPILLVVSGASALAASRSRDAAAAIGSTGIAVACAAGLVTTVLFLAAGGPGALSAPWNTMIGASFSIGLDPLSGVFLLAIYAVCGLAAVFGRGYLRTAHGPVGSHWLFTALLAASMALVVLARNAVLFLVAWEIMSLSSWLLVTFEHEREEARAAGVTYLVATQIGTAFLLVMFLLLGARGTGGAAALGEGAGTALDFGSFAAPGSAAAAAVFLLAVVGFGTKAGIVPLHVWLPEAHPAAPSPVSAVMSGVMIKTGIYGILRILSFLGAPPAWWGWTLLALGVLSALAGVIFALAQVDLKKLLAYSSVENIGIICMGLGVGLLGESYGSPLVAVLGFAAAILHLLNHAMVKALLFFGAGSAAAASGTRSMDRLGGLLRRMPWTGASFLAGSAAMTGLPPFGGFVGELLLFLAGLTAVSLPSVGGAAAGGVVIGALALASGLAAACFTRAFGITFLGEPRSEGAASATERTAGMVVPVVVLAAASSAIGLLGWLVIPALVPVAAALAGVGVEPARTALAPAAGALVHVAAAAAALSFLAVGLGGLRALLQGRRPAAQAVTWDCGYGKPTARMQYTSSSFAQPLIAMFHGLLGTRRHVPDLETPFPSASTFSTHTADRFSTAIILPGIRGIVSVFSRIRWLQHGRLQLYVLYIAAALVILLAWRLA